MCIQITFWPEKRPKPKPRKWSIRWRKSIRRPWKCVNSPAQNVRSSRWWHRMSVWKWWNSSRRDGRKSCWMMKKPMYPQTIVWWRKSWRRLLRWKNCCMATAFPTQGLICASMRNSLWAILMYGAVPVWQKGRTVPDSYRVCLRSLGCLCPVLPGSRPVWERRFLWRMQSRGIWFSMQRAERLIMWLCILGTGRWYMPAIPGQGSVFPMPRIGHRLRSGGFCLRHVKGTTRTAFSPGVSATFEKFILYIHPRIC